MSNGDENRRNPVRKLNFDRPLGQPEHSPSPIPEPLDAETDPNFVFPTWIFEGVDLDARIRALREELIRKGNGESNLQMPGKDPRNRFRTEYRRILAARDVINEAIEARSEELDWLMETYQMSKYDLETLLHRKPIVEASVRRLQEEIASKGSSVGILEGTQTAVKAVLDIYDDMSTPGDTNPPEMETNFGRISKLCGVAMDSYDEVQRKNEEMRKEVIAKRAKQRREHEMARALLSEPERNRVDEAADVFRNLSLEQLRELRDKLKNI